jgi:NADP-dependent 3-hydroxy acid dehydrogenase YdfG
MGVVNGLQTFLPAMLEHGEEADIINTSSIAGVRRYPGLHPMAVYATTKFAVVGLSETLATEMEDTQIGVSVLCPDKTQSNLFTVDRNRPQSYGGAYKKNQAIRRF